MAEKHLTASELAERFNVEPVTVRAWLKKGLFPNAKLEENIQGKIWLVPEGDLVNFRKPTQGRPVNNK
jgi:transcriptional regulator with XRE-family HTH domain